MALFRHYSDMFGLTVKFIYSDFKHNVSQRQQNQRHLIVMSFHQCENKINGHRGLNLDLLGFFHTLLIK